MAFDPGSLLHLASGTGPARVHPRDLVILTDELDDHDLATDLAPGQEITPELLTTLRTRVADARALADDGTVARVGPGVALCRARPGDVRRWRRAGRGVRVWTVDDPQDLDLCLALGVEAVITNDPGALRRQLTDRQLTDR